MLRRNELQWSSEKQTDPWKEDWKNGGRDQFVPEKYFEKTWLLVRTTRHWNVSFAVKPSLRMNFFDQFGFDALTFRFTSNGLLFRYCPTHVDESSRIFCLIKTIFETKGSNISPFSIYEYQFCINFHSANSYSNEKDGNE